jgi:hypothetical protein
MRIGASGKPKAASSGLWKVSEKGFSSALPRSAPSCLSCLTPCLSVSVVKSLRESFFSDQWYESASVEPNMAKPFFVFANQNQVLQITVSDR